MADNNDPIAELDALLAEAGAEPKFVRQRITRSYLYDAEYHMAMIACAFSICATIGDLGRPELLRPWLKLLQFVAARPRLAPDLIRWASTRRQQDFETWSKMPRGYIGDRTHDAVVDLLVANGTLSERGDYLVYGAHGSTLERIFQVVFDADLFQKEREIMHKADSLRVSKAMLGGQ